MEDLDWALRMDSGSARSLRDKVICLVRASSSRSNRFLALGMSPGQARKLADELRLAADASEEAASEPARISSNSKMHLTAGAISP